MKLSCHNLTRKFGDTTALNGVNLCLDEPKIYGLLGRNGAGKTTLLRLITNYIRPKEQSHWTNKMSGKTKKRSIRFFWSPKLPTLPK